MFKALKNEMYKIFTGKKIYFLSMVLVLISLGMALIMKKISTLENAREILLNSQSYFVTFFSQIGAMVFPILIVIATGGMLSDENRDGTLKLTLMAPVTRMQLLTAKISAMILSNVFMLLVTAIGCYIISGTIFGWSSAFILDDMVLGTMDGFIKTAEFIGIMLIPASAFGMVVLLFSLIMNNSGIIVGLCIGIHLVQIILQNSAPNLRQYLLSAYMAFGYNILDHGKAKLLIPLIAVCSIYALFSFVISAVNISRRDILS